MRTKIQKSLSYAAGFYSKAFEELLEFAGEQGFDGVQFIPDQSPNLYSEFSTARIENLLTMMSRWSLKPSVHNVFYDINICSLVPDVRRNSIEITKSVLEFCRDIGSSTLTVHPGYIYPGWRNDPRQNEAFWREGSKSLRELTELAFEYGVSVLFENGSYCLSSRTSEKRMDFHLGIEPLELKRILDLAGSKAGVCMDIGKLRVSGVCIDDFLQTLGDRVQEVQVSSNEDLAYVTTLCEYSQADKINVVFEGRNLNERTRFLDNSFLRSN